MTTIATFEIEGCFKLPGHELVIYGIIISGLVSKDNFFTFNIGQENMKLKIKNIDFVDNIKEKIDRIGLTFH